MIVITLRLPSFFEGEGAYRTVLASYVIRVVKLLACPMRGDRRGVLAGSTSNVDDRRGSLSGRFHKRWWSGFRPAPAWERQATLATVS